MSDYNEHVEDELKQMREGDDEELAAEHGFHLEDPISSIDLRDPVTAVGSTSVADALELMKKFKIGCLLIVKKDILEGIFTERDIIRRIVGKHLAHEDIQIKDYMTRDPDTLTEDAPLAFALNYMVLGGFRHVPIVDEKNHALGCLSIKDIVKHIGDIYFSKISNLPPRPKNPGWESIDGG